MGYVVISVTVLLLVCKYYIAAEPENGGCSPSPPNTLNGGGPPGSLFSNNVPEIYTEDDAKPVQPMVGGQRTDSWAVFSATQV